MASEKQFTANRANSLKSTGPKTPAGKAAVRLNALRHGLYASLAVLPGESQQHFDQLCDSLHAEWNPQTTTEHIVLQRVAVCHWTQVRLAGYRLKAFESAASLAEQCTLLDRFDQHDARLQHSLQSAVNHLRSLQKGRPPTAAAKSPESAETPAELHDSRMPEWCEGLGWLDKDGNGTVVVNPAIRGADGEWHEVTPDVIEKMLDERDKR
jgi:hypothetical protein